MPIDEGMQQDPVNNDNAQVPEQPIIIPENQNNARIPFSTAQILLIISIPMLSAGTYYCINNIRSPLACDMSIPDNRDLNSYYGIVGNTNPFITISADQCDSKVLFKPALPPSILTPDHTASSFLLLAKYGTGKTLLRCEYYKSLRVDSYLKILLLNKEISEYIERFVSRKSMKEADCVDKNCLKDWTDNEFAQLLLSTLVTEFISIFKSGEINFKDISSEEKFHLIRIICYYYNGFGTNELENFINHFLDKSGSSIYVASKAVVQIEENNERHDKPLLTHLKNDLEQFSILKQDVERIHLLVAVAEGEQFQNKASEGNMHENVFNDLVSFSLFIKKKMNKTPVFIIDGIDENRYFFQDNSLNKEAMKSFGFSSVSQRVVAKAMAMSFYLSIFYPRIDGVNIDKAIIKKDKFPTLSIDWSTNSLVNYADYALEQMNRNASVLRCKSFQSFKTLVNYSDKRNADIINKIPTPRDLHYFMIYLIKQMNDVANVVSKPFIATFENVEAAYKSAIKHRAKIETSDDAE